MLVRDQHLPPLLLHREQRGYCGRRGKTRIDRANFSIAERRTCKQDVGADREPEGVVAHDRYLDEHAQDRENDHNERSDKTKIHCAYLRGYDETPKNLACMATHGNVRNPAAGSTRPSESIDLPLVMRVCSSDCDVRTELYSSNPRPQPVGCCG
jgi:hypothetical protein